MNILPGRFFQLLPEEIPLRGLLPMQQEGELCVADLFKCLQRENTAFAP